MANNIPSFETELLNLFVATSNIDTATKTKLRNRFVAAYPSEWTAFRNQTTPQMADTVTNRAKFAMSMIVHYLKAVYSAESHREAVAALPPKEELI